MSLVIPDGLLTPVELNKIKAVIYKVKEQPFKHYLVESKYQNQVLGLLEASDDSKTFVIRVVSEVFALGNSVKTTADLAGILAVVTSLYTINPQYGNRLLNYYKTLSIK